MPCPSCGFFTATNDQFCAKCGTQLGEAKQQFSEVIEEEQEVVGTCPNCSAGVTAGQLYCSVCGTSLVDVGSTDVQEE